MKGREVIIVGIVKIENAICSSHNPNNHCIYMNLNTFANLAGYSVFHDSKISMTLFGYPIIIDNDLDNDKIFVGVRV